MLLRVLLIILASSLIGCAGSSIKKPVLELGVIDYPRNEMIVNMTDGSSVKSAADLKYSVVVESIVFDGKRVPLSTYDKGICFTPPNWEKLQNYLNELERANTNTKTQ